MDEEKRKKVAVAITVNAVILVFIIVAIIIYQLVTISSLNAKKKKLYSELNDLRQKYSEATDLLKRLQYDEDFKRIVESLGNLGEDISKIDPIEGVGTQNGFDGAVWVCVFPVDSVSAE